MNNEYITKQQAIDLAESLQAFIGIAGASLFIKEVERMPDCWVSVKDRLPEQFCSVIVYEPDCGIGEAEWDGNKFHWVLDENIAFASHWMPMPKQPKGE